MARTRGRSRSTPLVPMFAVALDTASARAEVELAAGVVLEASYAGEVFTAPAQRHTAVAGLATVVLDLDLATLLTRPLGTARVVGFGIHGEGLSEDLGEVLGVSNNVADPDVRLFEAWIEQPIGAVTLRAGLLAADQEMVIAEQSAALLGATFGMIGMFAANIVDPIYPVATPGLSARVEHGDLAVRAAVYADRHDHHGLPTSLGDGALAFGEVQLGAIDVGAWHHTERGDGTYAIVDGLLADGIGAFARVGLSNDGPFTFYLDGGVRVRGFSTGLAFARTDVGAQTLVEATYRAEVLPWLVVQPAAQLVFVREDTHPVLAMRVVVALPEN